MVIDFFLFRGGPWGGSLRENAFYGGLAPSSLLVGGGPVRYVLTAQQTRLSDGTLAAVYRRGPDRGEVCRLVASMSVAQAAH
jgi:hypothetical protein